VVVLMKMVIFEKWFINSEKHAERVAGRAEKLLQFTDLKEGRNYLEVGCGVGAVCNLVAERYHWNVTGVDMDPKQIKQAREKSGDLQNVRFLTADATNLPFPDEDFDIVLSFGTTHHISNWLDALGEVKRVLKPKGYFIYYDLLYPGLMAKLGRSFKHNYGIPTMPDLDEFIQKNNLSKIHTAIKNSLVWYDYEAVYQRN
jgi:ubiquinone/menaquinone biosynthesis C-methylase UbiE